MLNLIIIRLSRNTNIYNMLPMITWLSNTATDWIIKYRHPGLVPG